MKDKSEHRQVNDKGSWEFELPLTRHSRMQNNNQNGAVGTGTEDFQSHMLFCSMPAAPTQKSTGSTLPSPMQTKARTSENPVISCTAQPWPSETALLLSHRASCSLSAFPLIIPYNAV